MNIMLKKYHHQVIDAQYTRKVVENGNIREERYYFNGYEVYYQWVNGRIETERVTHTISDGDKVFAMVDVEVLAGTRSTEHGETSSVIRAPLSVIRYQYDNHLGSACLELDINGSIISYEEYHPFGTTSYRSGRSDTEVSLKRYKYCGKERDEESGLYYYGMRYYVPWLCRFVSVDPLQHKYPELTPFQYASNNPITMIDLDGMEGADPQTATITGTIYLKFDTDMDNESAEDKAAYIENFKQNIMDTWHEQHTYNGMAVTVDITVKEFVEGDTVGDNASLLIVGKGYNAEEASQKSKTSYINEDRRSGYMYFDNKGREAGHEFGHLLGLSDRYIRVLRYDGDKLDVAETLPLYMGKEENISNMYSDMDSNVLTEEQLSIVFSNQVEETYHAPVIITGSKIPENYVAQVSGINVALGTVNSRGNFNKKLSKSSAKLMGNSIRTRGLIRGRGKNGLKRNTSPLRLYPIRNKLFRRGNHVNQNRQLVGFYSR